MRGRCSERALLRALAAGLAHPIDESGRGRVDVEEARASGAGVPEAVPHPRRSGDEGARPGAKGLVAERELELAFEDVERVGVLRVDVRVDGAELGRALELDHLELRPLRLDDELSVLAGYPLALAGA